MENIENHLEELKDKIINRLSKYYPKIKVTFYINFTIVRMIKVKSMYDKLHYPYGENAYIGMKQGIIRVEWDKFFDRIGGNRWTYAQDWIFKFDSKDGSCKHKASPPTVEEGVNEFIEKMLKNITPKITKRVIKM